MTTSIIFIIFIYFWDNDIEKLSKNAEQTEFKII